MPYHWTKEGNISHTSLHWLYKAEKAAYILAIITVGCWLAAWLLKL